MKFDQTYPFLVIILTLNSRWSIMASWWPRVLLLAGHFHLWKVTHEVKEKICESKQNGLNAILQ